MFRYNTEEGAECTTCKYQTCNECILFKNSNYYCSECIPETTSKNSCEEDKNDNNNNNI